MAANRMFPDEYHVALPSLEDTLCLVHQRCCKFAVSNGARCCGLCIEPYRRN